MATPLTAARLLKALRDEGLKVAEHRSWRTHHRNAAGPWGGVHGVMIHHTVTSGTGNSVELCYNGYTGLPGPLCHGVIAKDGTVYLVGNGRANHAGRGDRRVLDAVIKEAATPSPQRNDTDGNRVFYGFECVNLGDGKDPWPAAQLLAIERAAAALCRAHGWSRRSVIGHLEWQVGKIDPRGFSMRTMRTRIGKRLGGSAPGPQEPPPAAPASYEPFPGPSFFRVGRNSPVVTAMGRRLVAEGCGRYQVGPGPQWTSVDQASYAAWQRKLGFTGPDADGIPGRTSWNRLKVPRKS
ncbi:hypothetical protein GCM10009716_31840 [Streptomyces sodiiphilus]|uniref:N-acetylmuramoyl-L-alanine amidase domain-containing protein n=1 Tax=Streptomyces sodiiphilus TaxID=226217 RepID=A0ABP5AV06_9ACTN